jgi:general transcription factor 3C polypeptide 3 (transcription factor C subunit 4)
LNWLDPADTAGEGRVLKYSHLCRRAADGLLEAGFNQNALVFYQPLKQIPGLANDASLYVQMGKCFLNEQLDLPAEECLQTAIQLDRDHIEARMLLARFYEKLNEQEQAFIYVNEVLSLRRSKHPSSSQDNKTSGSLHKGQSFMPSKGPRSCYKPRRLADPNERLKEEKARAEQLQSQYYTLRRAHLQMTGGDEGSTDVWMDAARDLTDDFRGFKPFYPWDKYVRFLGYTGDTRLQAETPLDSDLTAMADRLSRSWSILTGDFWGCADMFRPRCGHC